MISGRNQATSSAMISRARISTRPWQAAERYAFAVSFHRANDRADRPGLSLSPASLARGYSLVHDPANAPACSARGHGGRGRHAEVREHRAAAGPPRPGQGAWRLLAAIVPVGLFPGGGPPG